MKLARNLLSYFLLMITNWACANTSNVKQVIESKFQPLVDRTQAKEKRYQSILVAVVTPFETRVIPLGALTEKGQPATSTTIFEIGSITKGFLGLLLANEKLRGTLDLNQSYSSKSLIKLPQYKGKEIAWHHLAQHTSGLPRLPDNLKPENPLQPYVDYDWQKLKSYLKSFQFSVEPGVNSEYSNLGAGLCGYGLEQVYKKPLEQLFRDVFLDSLNMRDTRVALSPEQNSRLAPVFLNGEPVEAWSWKNNSVLQGAGALRSTMQDMTTFLKMMMGLEFPEFTPLVKVATAPVFEQGKNSQVGLFWNYLKSENIVWHNGGTYGSSSFMGYDPDRLVGVVVLSNSQIIGDQGIDPRLDHASISLIQEVASSLKMDKPVKFLKDYDTQASRNVEEFEKVPTDLRSKEWVQLKISHMFNLDQQLRTLFTKAADQGFSGTEMSFFQFGYLRRFQILSWQNTRDLKALIKSHGWFKISKWGAETDRQAWLLVQHADDEPNFQEEVLSLLSKLYKSKETDPSNYAYLHDRVASSFKNPSQRKPQRYGTQGSCVGPGKWEPFPIEDMDGVDERRAELGLIPLGEYIASFKDICR